MRGRRRRGEGRKGERRGREMSGRYHEVGGGVNGGGRMRRGVLGEREGKKEDDGK